MGGNTRRNALVHGFCFFKPFFMGPKELNQGQSATNTRSEEDFGQLFWEWVLLFTQDNSSMMP